MSTLTPAEATDLFRAAPHRYLDVGAGQAAYRRVGTGPDVLFVHGWPVSGATFRRLLPHLADHVTCHVIDLPSSGSSRFDDTTPLSIEQHITTVRRVVIVELRASHASSGYTHPTSTSTPAAAAMAMAGQPSTYLPPK